MASGPSPVTWSSGPIGGTAALVSSVIGQTRRAPRVRLVGEAVELRKQALVVVAVDLVEGCLELESAARLGPESELHVDLTRALVDDSHDLERVVIPGLVERLIETAQAVVPFVDRLHVGKERLDPPDHVRTGVGDGALVVTLVPRRQPGTQLLQLSALRRQTASASKIRLAPGISPGFGAA